MLLKKAGMVVLGTAAGVAALSGTAFAGDAPEGTAAGHGHSWDRDGGHDHDHGHGHDRDGGGRDSIRFSDDDASPSAYSGPQTNTGDQLIGVNNTNVQAPIAAVLSVLGANEL